MQEVPIKLYRTPDRLTVAAPMPGLLPEDITIEVTANHHLVLHGALRGVPADVQVFRRLERPHGRSRRKQPKVVEEQREMLVDEWTVGSYQRDIELPMPGRHARHGDLRQRRPGGGAATRAAHPTRAGEPGARRH